MFHIWNIIAYEEEEIEGSGRVLKGGDTGGDEVMGEGRGELGLTSEMLFLEE